MKIPKRLILKGDSLIHQQVEEVFALMDKYGLSFQFGDQTIIVRVAGRTADLPPIHLEDIETDDGPHELPPATEYHLVFENPEWLEAEHAKQQANLARRKQEEAIAKKMNEEKNAEIAKKDSIRRAENAQKVIEAEKERLRRLMEEYPEKG